MSKTLAKTINISLPADLVKKIDQATKLEYATRSDYIRDALVRKLRLEQGEEWETVIDFTKIKKGGINVRELLERVQVAKQKQ